MGAAVTGCIGAMAGCLGSTGPATAGVGGGAVCGVAAAGAWTLAGRAVWGVGAVGAVAGVGVWAGATTGTDCAVVCCAAVAQAGSVARAITPIPTSPATDKRREARPCMIITSLLSSTRRLLARMPITVAIAGERPCTAALDRASNDSA